MKKVKLPPIKLTEEEISERIKEVYLNYPEFVKDIAEKLAGKRNVEVKALVGHIVLIGHAFCNKQDTPREVSLSFLTEKAWIAAKLITNNDLWTQEIDALHQEIEASIKNGNPGSKPESE